MSGSDYASEYASECRAELRREAIRRRTVRKVKYARTATITKRTVAQLWSA